jgi:hypothetical protein
MSPLWGFSLILMLTSETMLGFMHYYIEKQNYRRHPDFVRRESDLLVLVDDFLQRIPSKISR